MSETEIKTPLRHQKLISELALGGAMTCAQLEAAGVGSGRSIRRWVKQLEAKGLLGRAGRQGQAFLWQVTDAGRELAGEWPERSAAPAPLPAAEPPLPAAELALVPRPAVVRVHFTRQVEVRVASAPAGPTLLQRAKPVLIGAGIVAASPLIALAAGCLAWRALAYAVGSLAGETREAVRELRAA